MAPPQPTVLDDEDEVPLGWEGAQFPLSKPQIHRRVGASKRGESQSRLPESARPIRNLSLPDASPRGYMRLNINETKNGWNLLTTRVKDSCTRRTVSPRRPSRTSSPRKPRKGELEAELVKAVWGGSSPPVDVNNAYFDTETEIEKINARKQHKTKKIKVPENLMDVLLQNWTFFEHGHGDLESTDKHIHAKYCEKEFGHFLLAGNHHVHGQFYVAVQLLVPELKLLLSKLRTQILPSEYKPLPTWIPPKLEELPELDLPPMPSMPQLNLLEGLLPVPSEVDEKIPNDIEAPIFKAPTPREYPQLILPEPLQAPPLILPAMPPLLEDESSIKYELYEEEPLPIFVPPPEDPLPTWVEPEFTPLPTEPVYSQPKILPPPVLERSPSFRVPLLDPRPCEMAYYQDTDGEPVCDGLCSKFGKKHFFVPGRKRKEPCLASPPPLLPIPSPPFNGADIVKLRREDFELLQDRRFQVEDAEKLASCGIPMLEEPLFQPPAEIPLPLYQPPQLKKEPIYIPLSTPWFPSFKEPKASDPLGWLAGQRPVFVIDCGHAMGSERMEAVQSYIADLFSPGGQVYVAATHFDVIMYSFDAWSFGTIENNYLIKQGTGLRPGKPLEPLREKTPEALEAAFNWVMRWRPAGASNLSKALNLATSFAFADCIYLFSEAKADKPVLMLEALKQQAQMQGGRRTPIYTVGLNTNKSKERFLRRLSSVTGGRYIEYDYRRPPRVQEGGDLEELEDLMWAKEMVEAEQERNAKLGNHEDIQDIMKRVEKEYEKAQLLPRKQAHLEKVAEHDKLHQMQLQAVQEENDRRINQARELHDNLCKEVMERNRANLKQAVEKWKGEVDDIRAANSATVDKYIHWVQEVESNKRRNEAAVDEAKKRYARDVRQVEVRNEATLQEAKQTYLQKVDFVHTKNQEAQEKHAKMQMEINAQVKAMNRAIRDEYEAAVKAIEASNSSLLHRKRALFEEQTKRTKAQNAKALQAAEARHEKHCDDIKKENAKKKEALAKKLDEIRKKKDEAAVAYQKVVEKCVSEHEKVVKAYNAVNAEKESKARRLWKEICDEIDKQNKGEYQKARKKFEDEENRVQDENIKLAERRLALKRRIAEVIRENDAAMKQKRREWKQACEEVEISYQNEVEEFKEMHKRNIEQLKLLNDEKIRIALIDHKAAVAAAKEYNETVKPFVEASRNFRTEVQRIETFLQRVANRVLPADRHAKQENSERSNLDLDIELLANSDAKLNTQIIVEALRFAYAKNISDMKNDPYISSLPKEVSSRLIPILPLRHVSQNCVQQQCSTSSRRESKSAKRKNVSEAKQGATANPS